MQTGQIYGLSPVWIRICSFMALDFVVCFSQNGQPKSDFPVSGFFSIIGSVCNKWNNLSKQNSKSAKKLFYFININYM